MTALKSALRKAGYMDFETRILEACREGLRQHPNDTEEAKRTALGAMDRETLLFLFENRYANDALRPWFAVVRKEIGGSAAAEPNRDGAGQPRYGAHRFVARPAREPSPSRVNATSLSAVSGVVKRAYLRTFFVNGKPIADITAGEAMRWAEGRQRDARFVKALCSTLPDNAVIGEAVTEDEAEAAWHVAERWNEHD